MKITLAAVGRVRGDLVAPIADYEARIAHYFSFEAAEVREETAGRGRTDAQVMGEEGKRLLARIPTGAEIVALDRRGKEWSSETLAEYLGELAVRGAPGAAFLIGGAIGLSEEVLARASRTLSLSALTLPHELARLVLTEQIYRAGTILRGEPYHKGNRPA
ncbi:MAG TPA: 23S rRNA (pseudouridine(1915)-N(3))-methyltransferase RlmH [Longimicrobiaceae bacterium]|nr:23S rRNA (pseudouridine(1915)-N(3))-methyltransferase RlmH [Longimicrobiaceae bacterium]